MVRTLKRWEAGGTLGLPAAADDTLHALDARDGLEDRDVRLQQLLRRRERCLQTGHGQPQTPRPCISTADAYMYVRSLDEGLRVRTFSSSPLHLKRHSRAIVSKSTPSTMVGMVAGG